MKHKTKNFIAFTLSEMMVVLLIVSVISAATLPAITNKKVENPPLISSFWLPDASNAGHCYVGPNNNEVIIGQDTSEWTAADMTALHTQKGIAALWLSRPISWDLISSGIRYANYGISDIVFFDQSNKVAGKITADERYNIAIGQETMKQDTSLHPMNNNLIIGHYAGYGFTVNGSISQSDFNTAIGNNALRNSHYQSDNLVIGNDIKNVRLLWNNVLVGYYAGSYSAYNDNNCTVSSNSVSVGTYSAFQTCHLENTVNVGSYSGAFDSQNALSKFSGARNQVNIGYKAGFNAGYTSDVNNDVGYSSVNVGAYAGYGSYSTISGTTPYKYIDSVAIGYYAGAQADTSLSIGAYAGVGQYSLKSYSSVNIGLYAGERQEKSVAPINIGYNAGNHSKFADSVINIGNFAGWHNNATDSINIGDNAGFDDYRTNDNQSGKRFINIGAYAGYLRQRISDSGSTHDNIHIGDTGSHGSTPVEQVIIGCEGHDISQNYRMCIGGMYPTANTNVVRDSFEKSAIPAASLFLPPGILHLSSGFSRTYIWLMANYILGYSNSFATFSDRTLKENIKPTKDGIEKVRKLNIREFNIKNDKTPRVGVIAQEIQEIYPNLVEKIESPNGTQYYTVRYDRFVYSLTQAVKDLDKMTIDLQKEVLKNISLTAKLTNRIVSVENKLNNLSKSDKYLQKRLKEIDSMISKAEHK